MLKFREAQFVELLGQLIPLAEKTQNDPAHGLVPQEELIARVVEAKLKPYADVLQVSYVSYTPQRGNLILKYAGRDPSKVISFVGSHLDVVPADAAAWQRPPFELVREGDRLYGRGVTDCLGHVALLTELFAQLGEQRPLLESSVVAVLICNEENASVAGIGVDGLAEHGLLDELRSGPIYWLDTANSQPCVGSGSVVAWRLEATGKLFHSGMAHHGINALELLHDAVADLQGRFYAAYPAAPQEAQYGYPTPSSMKPTVSAATGNGCNQVPERASCDGDIRMTPFYDLDDAQRRIAGWVEELNAQLRRGDFAPSPLRGTATRYKLDDGTAGSLRLEWLMDAPYYGIACDMASRGYRLLADATRAELGSCEPFASTGSLPLVRDLQQRGFDLQMVGYGLESTYHADNEYGLLSDFAKGFAILARMIVANGDLGKN